MKTKLGASTESFLRLSFNGDGKYYLTEQGSRSYRNTLFGSFFSRHGECVDVISRGNDAPKGGKTGDYVLVSFNALFHSKFNAAVEDIKRIKDAKIEKDRQSVIAAGEQSKRLSDKFKEDPAFLSKILDRVKNYTSKEWRGWVRMKVAHKINNDDFGSLALTATEIRDIAFNAKISK